MLRKFLSTAICISLITCSMTACGKQVELEEESSGSLTSSESQSGDYQNFTAPEKGEQIVIMTIKDMGDIKIKLFPDLAPTGVSNFVELAKQGYYDELIFHRVIKNFMIQGGDPKGNGTGGDPASGITFSDNDFSDKLTHVSGAVAYANSGATSTNGSQFYIVTGEKYDEATLTQMEQYYGQTYSQGFKDLYSTVGGAPYLDGGYTIFGQVFDGLDIVYRIQEASTDANDKPYDAVVIESVKVAEYDGSEVKWYISDYDPIPEAQPVETVNFNQPAKDEEVIVMNIKDRGTVKIKLFPEQAPEGVENFIGLAKQGYYDGLTFHRVINEFMIQGGDPNGNGTGGESIWGGKFDGKTSKELSHFSGAIAYANSGATSTNGSQFYIVTGQVYESATLDTLVEQYGLSYTDKTKEYYTTIGGTPFLDGGYTVFGQVFDGLDVIYDIQTTETDSSDKPVEDVIIESVTVEKYNGTDEMKWFISDYQAE